MTVVIRTKSKLGITTELGQLITDFTTDRSLISRSSWATAPDIEMYLRVCRVQVSHGIVGSALQIANVGVARGRRRQGVFSRWLLEIEDAVLRSPLVDYVYVENVLNQHLTEALIRRGYTKVVMCVGVGIYPEVCSYVKRMEVKDGPTE